MNKIKVVWICSFSNEKTRSKVMTKMPWLIRRIYKLKHREISAIDTAVWNTNALAEIIKFPQVELHVITPVRFMEEKALDYAKDGIYYHFFRDQNSSSLKWLFFQTLTQYSCKFRQNRKYIKQKISEINPSVVHLMGAENPYYSSSILDVPDNICTIAQLQALLCSIEVDHALRKEEINSFYYKGLLERKIINKVDYIGTQVSSFIEFIKKNIKEDARFLPISLACAQNVDLSDYPKEFDFVYFSVDIRKACDDAIEAFALAHQKKPSLTLDIVGGYDSETKSGLDKRIVELGLGQSIVFEGRLPTHDDVIKQIKKSRFALLPLKKDLVPSTIREAMASGLPVVTTITEGTPNLNKKEECVLLSEYQDYQAMADNMLRLAQDENLAVQLRQNGVAYMNVHYNNYDIVAKWVTCYENICHLSAI